MSHYPYPSDPLQAFDEIEADALALESDARDLEARAKALENVPGASKEAIRQLRIRATRRRRIVAFLGFMAGRVGNIHKLYESTRRETNYAGRPQA